MKIPKLKFWQWIALVVVVLFLIGNFAPEQEPVAGAETTSPVVLLWIPVIGLIIYLVRRSRKKSKIESEAAMPSAEKSRAEIARMNEELEFFANYENQYNEAEPGGVIAKKGEHVIAIVSEVGLIETLRGPTDFKGGSSGVSFRLTKRISVRKSGMKGRATPGAEMPTVVDRGKFVISDQRAVFVGTKQSREFSWDNLLSYDMQMLGRKDAVLYLPVSNRQKVSGIASNLSAIEQVTQRVAFGAAVASGRKEDFLKLLRDEIAQAEAELKNFGAVTE